MTNRNTDLLQEMLAAQDLLQRESYGGASPRDLLQGIDDNTNEPLAVEFISWNVQAAVDELHELLNETGWKPWASSNHVNIEAARGELIDVLHFVMNLALVLKLDPEDIHARYMAKRRKNAERQQAGYDGVSLKCPKCKRALDDDGVTCFLYADGKFVWCSEHRGDYRVTAA